MLELGLMLFAVFRISASSTTVRMEPSSRELDQQDLRQHQDYLRLLHCGRHPRCTFAHKLTESFKSTEFVMILTFSFDQVDVTKIGVTTFEGPDGTFDVEVFDSTEDYVKLMK